MSTFVSRFSFIPRTTAYRRTVIGELLSSVLYGVACLSFRNFHAGAIN